jgi:signal transduction histidine kinase
MTVLVPFTRSQTFFWLMAAVTLTSGGLVASGISRRRIAKLKAQAALAAERTRIARDMHDDVGARLSQISFMLKSLGTDAGLPVSVKEEVNQLTDAASEALGSLDEVVWTVNPKNDRLDALCRHLCGHASRYLGLLGISCRIESTPTWPNHVISAQVRHQVSMAFKEALQNVVKHSGASEVMLVVAMDDGDFVIRVSDNGRGLPEHPEKSERSGLENMKSRLAGVGGICDIHPMPTGGTEVEMRVPVR